MPRRTKAEIDKARKRSAQAHASRLKTTYGITADEYAALYAHQGGVCAICVRANGRTKRLAVDHDHAKNDADGKATRESIRGLLCGPCNRFIGRLGDSPAVLRRAAEYLENPPARKVLRNAAS